MAVMDFGDALNLALREEMRRDPRVYCIGEDIVLGVPFGVTKGLIEEFGADRVLNAPISEAAIVGSAMGAAMLTIFGLNLFGDGLRDLLDPKIRGLATERQRAA